MVFQIICNSDVRWKYLVSMGVKVPSTEHPAVVGLIQSEKKWSSWGGISLSRILSKHHLGGIHSPQVKDSCGEINSLRGSRHLPPRKEPVPTKSQGLLSDIPGFSFLCLPLTGCVTLNKFLNNSEPESPHRGLIAATCEEYPMLMTENLADVELVLRKL